VRRHHALFKSAHYLTAIEHFVRRGTASPLSGLPPPEGAIPIAVRTEAKNLSTSIFKVVALTRQRLRRRQHLPKGAFRVRGNSV
jgi:hypothetical protein